jgi:hypothetical protein
MAEIELGNKSYRDLMVIAVTTINSQSEKIDKLCAVVDRHENQLTIIQTEHNERKDTCGTVNGTNKRTVAASGGIGGVLGAFLLWLFDYLMRRGGN